MGPHLRFILQPRWKTGKELNYSQRQSELCHQPLSRWSPATPLLDFSMIPSPMEPHGAVDL